MKVGLLGLFDPAKKYFKLKAHKEDFGQTLGFFWLMLQKVEIKLTYIEKLWI